MSEEIIIESFGKILKNKREELSLEIEKICVKLNVKDSDIQAIEEENWHLINKNLYITGLIISYSKILKLDDKFINEQIKKIPIESNTKNKKHQLVNIGENLDLTPEKNMFFNFSIAFFLIFLIFLIVLNIKEDKTDLITNSFVIEKFNIKEEIPNEPAPEEAPQEVIN